MTNMIRNLHKTLGKKHWMVLSLVLAVSLLLNLWGNKWGAPDFWHADELTSLATRLVRERTVNPGYFAYGGLHYYVLALGAVVPAKVYGVLIDTRPPASNKKQYSLWNDRQKVRIAVMARSVSAVAASLLVLLTYFMGSVLFDRSTSLLAAVYLSVSPYFVAIAHFATVDMMANFMYWLACLMAVLFWKKENRVWFVLACFIAGLAIGTKLDRFVVLIPLLAACFIYDKKLSIRRVSLLCPLVILGYIAANPTILGSFFQFADGLTRETFFNIVRGEGQPVSRLQIVRYLNSGLGTPLFAAAVLGAIYGFYRALRGSNCREIGWLASTILPYYVLFSSRFAAPWYVPFLFPALTLFAAYMCVELCAKYATRSGVWLIRFGIVGIVCFTLASALSVALQFSHDSRYLAEQWITEHLPPGASIEVGPRGPAVSENVYKVAYRPIYDAFDGYDFARRWREKLTAYKPYVFIRRNLLHLEKYMNKQFNMPARRNTYEGWFDRVLKHHVTRSDSGGSASDCIVLVDYLEQKKIAGLSEANSGYEPKISFKYPDPFDLDLPFVNPRVYLFQRSSSILTRSPFRGNGTRNERGY